MPTYLTIDDLRLASCCEKFKPSVVDPPAGRTRIEVLNHTRSPEQVRQILGATDQLLIILGVQTPGRYLSARPGTLQEVTRLLKPFRFRKVLTGPVASAGTQRLGGADAVLPDPKQFDQIRPVEVASYDQLQPYALDGAEVVTQIPRLSARIAEIETGRGCPRSPGCSFCTEPLKNPLQWREAEHIIQEVQTLMNFGVRAFRLGKQSCIFSYQNGQPSQIERLLAGLAALKPAVLHIDNANPAMVTEKRTELFVKYLTPGSTAAMGVESFDPEVAKLNNLNCTEEVVFEAVRVINKIGGYRTETGCHALLPGINILLGLRGESLQTLERNLSALKRLLDEGLLVRRINIRQVVPYPGTALSKAGGRYWLCKNHRYYAGWVRKVREEIDFPMLQRLFPTGTVLRGLYSEVHDGNVTFLRQLASYPIVVGVKGRLALGRVYDVRITGHMLRSLTGEVIGEAACV